LSPFFSILLNQPKRNSFGLTDRDACFAESDATSGVFSVNSWFWTADGIGVDLLKKIALGKAD
jgi:hypothetical protein